MFGVKRVRRDAAVDEWLLVLTVAAVLAAQALLLLSGAVRLAHADEDSAGCCAGDSFGYEMVSTTAQVPTSDCWCYPDRPIEYTTETWEYPQFSGPAGSGVDIVNAAIAQSVEGSKGIYTTYCDFANYDLEYDVTYLAGSIASVRRSVYTCGRGGAHGWTYQEGAIYDLSSGETFTPWGYLGVSRESFEARVASSLKTWISSVGLFGYWGSRMDTQVATLAGESGRACFMSSSGMVYGTNMGDIGPTSASAPCIVVYGNGTAAEGTSWNRQTAMQKRSMKLNCWAVGTVAALQSEWGWGLFAGDECKGSSNFDNRLAVAGLCLSSGAEYGQSFVEDQLIGSGGLGFDKVKSINYSKGPLDIGQPAATFAYKKTTIDGRERNVFAVVVRGTSDVSDAITDAESIFGCFDVSAALVKSELEGFMIECTGKTRADIAKQDNIFFVTGHSLGGAVANILCTEIGDYAPKSEVFGYTFASPNTRSVFSDGGSWPNVHNVLHSEDIVPLVPPVSAGRYGTDCWWSRGGNGRINSLFMYITGCKGGNSLDSVLDSVWLWDEGSKVAYGHAPETYMAYLLSRGDAEEAWTYKVRRVGVHCPVDFEVRTAAGEVVGRVSGGAVDASAAKSVSIVVEGDEKYVYMPFDSDYRIVLTGTGAGAMSIDEGEYDVQSGRIEISRAFVGIALEEGKTLELDMGASGDEAARLFVTDSSGAKVREVAADGAESDYAEPAADVVRLGGDDRYGTMSQIVGAQAGGAEADAGIAGAPVVLATGGNFPDALAASGLAGALGATVVLTDGAALSTEAKESLLQLEPSAVYIAGGEAAVSAAVAGEVEALGLTVKRASGSDRVATAEALYAAGSGGWGGTAIVATGRNFADALAASPLAYARRCPVFLTGDDGLLRDSTLSLIAQGGFERVLVLGGTAAVAAGAEGQLAAVAVSDVRRLSGEDRYGTADSIVAYEIGEAGMGCARMAVATGENFPDALAGSSLCGRTGSVMCLVRGAGSDASAVRAAADAAAQASARTAESAYILGGTAAVSDSMEAAVASALG